MDENSDRDGDINGEASLDYLFSNIVDSADMKIYLFQDKIEEYEPAMRVKHEPVEYGKGNDIMRNSDQFKLTIYGKTYVSEYEERCKRIKFDV